MYIKGGLFMVSGYHGNTILIIDMAVLKELDSSIISKMIEKGASNNPSKGKKKKVWKSELRV